jgi:hypothetical protein
VTPPRLTEALLCTSRSAEPAEAWIGRFTFYGRPALRCRCVVGRAVAAPLAENGCGTTSRWGCPALRVWRLPDGGAAPGGALRAPVGGGAVLSRRLHPGRRSRPLGEGRPRWLLGVSARRLPRPAGRDVRVSRFTPLRATRERSRRRRLSVLAPFHDLRRRAARTWVRARTIRTCAGGRVGRPFARGGRLVVLKMRAVLARDVTPHLEAPAQARLLAVSTGRAECVRRGTGCAELAA